ncbi:uncharacterized protein PpBr36_09500 [Pyricularia pennisetigena]|uniref:uncharacterized protein n=1 Tax=Pyricularia pennisetigena TaxID=1578925 RepID=UPI0011519999|nr:uncharacterized protein PpBr36_09500 [Pyricularia pennisetigena]TLS21796.1 hypothetical protein PpBr36_09500 [Pyricularia pennisetigena]
MRSLSIPILSYFLELLAPPLDRLPAQQIPVKNAPIPSTWAQDDSAAAAAAATDFSLPRVAETKELGIAEDVMLNRDSCNSARLADRTLWTCRDTQWVTSSGLPQLAIISSTASWTDDGEPLRMYGDQDGRAFFPLLDGNCNDDQAGMCGDGTRYSIWPDSPPLVVADEPSSPGVVSAYTWIKQFRIDEELKPSDPDPASTLYRIDYDVAQGGGGSNNKSALPRVAVVNESFYPARDVAYGNYGHVTRDGVAYLYGQTSNGRVTLARTRATRASVEDRSTYEYFTLGRWTDVKPPFEAVEKTSCCEVPNASAGGQGTYFWSDKWRRYVWVGQAGYTVSPDFYITTAPAPEGPWDKPVLFYKGVGGNYSLSAYSLQAHPGVVLGDAGGGGDGDWKGEEMVLSYTRNDGVYGDHEQLFNIYTTPVVRVRWE